MVANLSPLGSTTPDTSLDVVCEKKGLALLLYKICYFVLYISVGISVFNLINVLKKS